MEQNSIVPYDRLPPLSPKYPWFVAQNLEDEDIREQIFFTIFKPSYHYQCQIPELVGRQIRAFFHGWVILSNHPHDLIWSLWNPVTSKIIHLPTLHGDCYECCLSSPPDDPASVFLLTTDKHSIMVCHLGETKHLTWTEISYANQLRSIIDNEEGFLTCLTCHNGEVYALHTGYESDCFYVIHVDIIIAKEEEVTIRLSAFVEVPDTPPGRNHSIGRRLEGGIRCFDMVYFLKGSGTELFYIEIGFEDEKMKAVSVVYLFKLDMTSMIWEEIEDLKDVVFFIELPNDHAVFYTPTIATESGGYVHIVDITGEVIYSYHVKDKTISVSSMSSLAGTSKVSSWAMLEFRLEGDYGEAKCATDSTQEEIIDKDKKTVVSPVAVNEVIESDESRLLDLPFHVLETVMEFCVVVEYMNFRATCKRCYLAAPSKQWSKKTMLTRLQTYSLLSPWLIVLEKHQMTLTDPMFGNKYYVKAPQELFGNWRIHCSRYGWLLLSNGRSLVFFNPFTSAIRKLPEAPYLSSGYFTEPPTSPDCMVLGLISLLDQWQVYIRFVARDPHEHSIIHLNVGGADPNSFCFPTYHQGGLCALCNEGKLYVYEYLNAEPLVIKTPSSSYESVKRYFLVKRDRNLLLVVVGEFGESVDVFKLNESTKEWEKIDGLGNHAIYICDSTCLCIEAKTSDMENKIYFPRLHCENGDMVLYSLETRTYHRFNGKNVKETLGDLFGTTSHCYPHTWIQPSWS